MKNKIESKQNFFRFISEKTEKGYRRELVFHTPSGLLFGLVAGAILVAGSIKVYYSFFG